MKEKGLLLVFVAIIAVAVATCCIVLMPSEKDNTLSYEESDDGTVIITGVSDYFNNKCRIPSSIDGKVVSAIGDYAFSDDDRFTKIEIPETIVKIGEGAFSGCSNVTSIKIGDNDLILYNGAPSGYDIVFGNDCFKGISLMDISFEREGSTNDALVKAVLKNIPENAEYVQIDTALNFETDIISKNRIHVIDSKMDVTVNFGTYGLFNNIKVSLLDENENVLLSSTLGGFAVTAEHYNFAMINATYPVLLFTLDLCHDSGEGDTLSTDPTFIYLERYKAYDWTKLPSNVSVMPFIPWIGTAENDVGFHKVRPAIAEYIGQLYELDNNSTFTLYCVDNYSEFILEYFVSNRIPETNWGAHLLTDGSGTAGNLCRAYGGEDPYGMYDKMVEDWNALKEEVWNTGYSTETIFRLARYMDNDSIYSMLNYYCYPISKEQPNVDWTTGRLRAAENLSAIKLEFANDIIAEAKQVYTNNLLDLLTPEEEVKFKELYHFSDEMFNEAKESGKKIMIILGTSGAGEGIIDTPGEQSLFYAYIRLTMDFFGDDYVYYYKGHPGYPTSLYSHRQEALDAINDAGYRLIELDNSIAAEVIMFYNPEVYLAGWKSTTFASVEDATKACAVFNSGKDVGIESYLPMIDLFMTALSGESYGNIVLEQGKQYFLIEYNNTSEYDWQTSEYSKHEIAIYNMTDDVLKYYKINTSSEYEEVSA